MKLGVDGALLAGEGPEDGAGLGRGEGGGRGAEEVPEAAAAALGRLVEGRRGEVRGRDRLPAHPRAVQAPEAALVLKLKLS